MKSDISIEFDPDNLTLVLNINDLIDVPDKIKYGAISHGFYQKKSYHITIIGTKTAKSIRERISMLSTSRAEKLRAEVMAVVRKSKWTYRLKSEHYKIAKTYYRLDPNPIKAKERREAIIQLAELKGSKDFFEALESILSMPLDMPLFHITLYAKSTNPEKNLRGIGIYSENDFSSLNPEKISSD